MTNGPYTFPAGVNHLDGDRARWYLGQLFSSGTLGDPGRLDAALLAVTCAVAVDDTLGDADLLGLAYSLRDLRPENVDSFTAPVLGTGTEGAASVVYLDEVTGKRMWTYLRNDSLSQNAEEFGDQHCLTSLVEVLPRVPGHLTRTREPARRSSACRRGCAGSRPRPSGRTSRSVRWCHPGHRGAMSGRGRTASDVRGHGGHGE